MDADSVLTPVPTSVPTQARTGVIRVPARCCLTAPRKSIG